MREGVCVCACVRVFVFACVCVRVYVCGGVGGVGLSACLCIEGVED